MQRNPSYLTLNRHGTFYFRIVIPQHLRSILSGQREVRRTLKTDSLTLARRRARQYAARYQAAFDRVTNVIERDELGFSEDDYTELLDLMPDFSSPKSSDKSDDLSFRTPKSRLGNVDERSNAFLLELTADPFPANKNRWRSICSNSLSHTCQPS